VARWQFMDTGVALSQCAAGAWQEDTAIGALTVPGRIAATVRARIAVTARRRSVPQRWAQRPQGPITVTAAATTPMATGFALTTECARDDAGWADRHPDQNGSELQTRLNALGFVLPVIFLTGYSPEINSVVQAIKAGAEDVLIKPIKSDELLSAIDKAVGRHEKSRPSRVAMDAHRVRFASLTPRERQVFQLVVRGNVNKQIAHQLGMVQRERIMEKMQVQSFAELVSIAVRVGELND